MKTFYKYNIIRCRPIVEDEAQIESGENENSYQNLINHPKYDGTLAKKYLTEELFNKLHELQSEHPTIIDCLAKFNALHTDLTGVVALNASCYTMFCDLFDPIIQEIHCIDELASKYPDSDWNVDALVFQKIESDLIMSVEISCTRSLMNFPFVCGANENDLQTILMTVRIFVIRNFIKKILKCKKFSNL